MRDLSMVTAEARRGLPVAARCALFFGMVAATTLTVLALAVIALSPGGLSAVDLLLLALYAAALPWLVIGFSISVIGFCVMRFARDPVAAIFPAPARIRGDEPVAARTPSTVCIRHHAPRCVS